MCLHDMQMMYSYANEENVYVYVTMYIPNFILLH